MSDTFFGYSRADGSYGLRNYVLILPSVICSVATATNISKEVEGTVSFSHQAGCAQIGEDLAQTFNTLAGCGKNPNISAVLVVSLGCESIDPYRLGEEIAKTGKPVEVIKIQDLGGTSNTVNEGIKIAKKLQQHSAGLKREEAGLEKLVLGLECGSSDFTSGLSANPAVGYVSDKLVRYGGTVYLSEITELIGAEHILAKRASCPEIREKIIQTVKGFEKKLKKAGIDFRGGQPTPGNIKGGLTTIEEKSLGAIYKAGSANVKGVLKYAEKASTAGLYLMETPGFDIESITGMIAGGCQIVIFTTGSGTPTGSPFVPVVKVCGNSKTSRLMSDNIDIDAGSIVDGEKGVEEIGEQIIEELIKVANGKLVKAEVNGFKEFAINRIGPSM